MRLPRSWSWEWRHEREATSKTTWRLEAEMQNFQRTGLEALIKLNRFGTWFELKQERSANIHGFHATARCKQWNLDFWIRWRRRRWRFWYSNTYKTKLQEKHKIAGSSTGWAQGFCSEWTRSFFEERGSKWRERSRIRRYMVWKKGNEFGARWILVQLQLRVAILWVPRKHWRVFFENWYLSLAKVVSFLYPFSKSLFIYD